MKLHIMLKIFLLHIEFSSQAFLNNKEKSVQSKLSCFPYFNVRFWGYVGDSSS